PYKKPLMERAGFKVLKGNLFDAAIMKISVISDAFRKTYLSDPKDPDAFEGHAVVFDGPEDYHRRIDDPALKIDERSILFMRGVARPIGSRARAKAAHMRPPGPPKKRATAPRPATGAGRKSGTSGPPSTLNAPREAAANGGLALLEPGARVRIDLRKGTADIL